MSNYQSSFYVIDLKLDIEPSLVHWRRSVCSAAACCKLHCVVMNIYAQAAGGAYRSAKYSSSLESVSELRGVTCHMGSRSVTCHPTLMNAHHLLNPSQPGRYSIYLPRRDGRLS